MQPHLCFTFICSRPNDGSIFIPNKAQYTIIVDAHCTQGEYSTGHFLLHKSSQMNCTSLQVFFLSHSPICSPRDAWADGSRKESIPSSCVGLSVHIATGMKTAVHTTPYPPVLKKMLSSCGMYNFNLHPIFESVNVVCDTLTFFNDSILYGLQFSWHQGST